MHRTEDQDDRDEPNALRTPVAVWRRAGLSLEPAALRQAVGRLGLGAHDAPDAVARWLRRPRGSTLWCALALMAGLLSLPGFIAHWRVLAPPYVLVSWLLFALVNPFFEEGYWRGLVLDTTRGWPGAISVTYSAAWFAVSHPLIWGVHSAALREWAVIPVLMALGIVWAMAYRRNGSLWCSIAGHMCSNLFGLAVPIMLNLYSPMSQ